MSLITKTRSVWVLRDTLSGQFVCDVDASDTIISNTFNVGIGPFADAQVFNTEAQAVEQKRLATMAFHGWIRASPEKFMTDVPAMAWNRYDQYGKSYGITVKKLVLNWRDD